MTKLPIVSGKGGGSCIYYIGLADFTPAWQSCY